MASTNLDQVAQIAWEFDRAYEAQRADFMRSEEAWRAYFPVDAGQWDEVSRAIMADEKRHCAQYDVIGPKVDMLAGSLLSEMPDLNWHPVEGDRTETSDAIADVYDRDKELFNYDWVFLNWFRDGLVHSGDIAVEESRRYGTPRVCLSRMMPGFLVWDPYWKTDDDRDAEVAFRVNYFNALQLKQKYEASSDAIEAAIADLRLRDTPGSRGDEQRRRFAGRVGDEYKVIEKHYLRIVRANRLIGRQEGGDTWIPFPVSKDEAFLDHFAEVNGIDWTTVLEDPYEDRIHYVAACAPDLSRKLVLEDEKSRVQVNGLPFYHFTPRRSNGRNMGMVETILDTQRTINKRESLVTELVSKANGGSTLANRNMFANEKQRQDWTKKKNRPGHVEFVDLDAAKTPFVNLANNQYPASVVDQLTRMYDKVLPMVSRASDALSSLTSSEDNALLYERKFQLNMIANTLINRTMRQCLNNVGEGYFYQWQITYADREMMVASARKDRKTILNKREGAVLLNSTMAVPRCAVSVTENTKSPIYQSRWRSQWMDMLKTIDPQVALPQYIVVLRQFFRTIELPEQERQELDFLGELMGVKARLGLVADILRQQADMGNSKLQTLTIDQQINALMQQMQAQTAITQRAGAQALEQGGPRRNNEVVPITAEAASPNQAQTPPQVAAGQVPG